MSGIGFMITPGNPSAKSWQAQVSASNMCGTTLPEVSFLKAEIGSGWWL